MTDQDRVPPPVFKQVIAEMWKKWPLVLMILHYLQQEKNAPVKQDAVAAYLPIRDPKQVRGYLQDLDVRGYALSPFQGSWVVTDVGIEVVGRLSSRMYQITPDFQLLETWGKTPEGGGKPPLIVEDILLNKSTQLIKTSSWGKIPPELEAALEDASVFRSCYTDIIEALGAGWTADDVMAVIRWQKDGGRIVSRVRDRTKAPRQFYHEDVESFSRSKYVKGEYAEFIES